MTRARKSATRAITAAGIAFAAVTLGPATTPAHAASSITARHSITIPGMVRHQINVHLPMNQEDASGYIYNGARIEIKCWGEDFSSDTEIGNVPRADKYTGAPKPAPYPPGFGVLTATESGIHLKTLDLYEKADVDGLNEDQLFGNPRDEVYCKATFVDADGHTLTAKTNVVKGYF